LVNILGPVIAKLPCPSAEPHLPNGVNVRRDKLGEVCATGQTLDPFETCLKIYVCVRIFESSNLRIALATADSVDGVP